MKSGYRWSVLGSLLSLVLAANIVHAQQQETAAERGDAGAAGAPVIADGHSFRGQRGNVSSPSDSAGAIGPFSYIQLIERSVSIYNRHSQAVIATGTLNQLAGNSSVSSNTYPQILWDATTNRFYYAMATRTGSSSKLSFGFSKTPNPTTISSADWCHYVFVVSVNLKSLVDYSKLGDNKDFLIIGFQHRTTTSFGGNIFAVAKPPAGMTCPEAASLKSNTVSALDASGAQVWAPVPANQVDDRNAGHVVARNLSVPSNKLWLFRVSKDAEGFPRFGPGRALTVPSYAPPPNATQPDSDRRLDTGDARPSPAVQAINPARGTHSFWFTQTVKHATEERSVVRWYEVDPGPLAPVLLRTGVIGNSASDTFFFNAAISPDRRKDGATAQFGDSFVIQYDVSSSTIHPGIAAASSFKGGGLKSLSVRKGISQYLDNTCTELGSVCAWGHYSSAVPDPRPTAVGSGVVWGTNQYSGTTTPRSDRANFRTWIFAVQP
jgi:hypothetical protein